MTRKAKKIYSEFAAEKADCWACRYQPLPSPDLLGYAFNKLEIAHIVGGPGRVADRRAINMLCMIHHHLEQGMAVKLDGCQLPKLTIENMIWLKQQCDPDNYDLAFIRSLRIKSAEPIEPAPVMYLCF